MITNLRPSTAAFARLARFGAAFLCLLLVAGCDDFDAGGESRVGGAGDWIKHGADSAETAREYRDCLDMAQSATRKDADIDQDIAATRGADLQRSQVVQARTAQMADKTRRSTDSIIASCMRQKGFAERR